MNLRKEFRIRLWKSILLSPLLIFICLLESCTSAPPPLIKSHTQAVKKSHLLKDQLFYFLKKLLWKIIWCHFFKRNYFIPTLNHFVERLIEFTLRFAFFKPANLRKSWFHFNKMGFVWRGTVWFQRAMTFICCILPHGLRNIHLMCCCLFFLFCKIGLTKLSIWLPDVY